MNLTLDLVRIRLPKRYDFLALGIVLSICLHVSVLLVKLTTTAPPSVNQAQNLEIILVNTESKHAPLDPKLIAQANLLGGGDQDTGLSTSPIPKTSQVDSELLLSQMLEQQKELENKQKELLMRLKAQLKATISTQQSQQPDSVQSTDQDTNNQHSVFLSAQIAAIEEKIQTYNAQPKQQFTGPSAKSDALAQYLETWRHQIELLGTQHYPEQARGKIYGSLQLTVYIKDDGSLQNIEIDKPSQHAILNLAAQRIVQLAAPFAPLPDEVSQNTDVLAITRTWNFQNQQLKTNIP